MRTYVCKHQGTASPSAKVGTTASRLGGHRDVTHRVGGTVRKLHEGVCAFLPRVLEVLCRASSVVFGLLLLWSCVEGRTPLPSRMVSWLQLAFLGDCQCTPNATSCTAVSSSSFSRLTSKRFSIEVSDTKHHKEFLLIHNTQCPLTSLLLQTQSAMYMYISVTAELLLDLSSSMFLLSSRVRCTYHPSSACGRRS